MAKLEFVTAFNSYREISLLGEGGAGRVYKVQDSDGQLFAIKCLTSNKQTKKRRRFSNEIRFCEQNTHKNIVRVQDHGTITMGGEIIPFCVMPLYSSTLRQLMRDGIPSDKKLPYLVQILDGVEAAHLQNTWHRDLKPENILYDSRNDALAIADFGIAHFNEDILVTMVETTPGERLANFQYAAPEQRAAGRLVDQRADIYALGLIANELFTGEVLQGAGYKKISDVAPDYPYLDAIIDKMVQQLPERRYGSIKEIKQELIAHGNEWLALQKLNQLKRDVVPESDIDDPLVTNPAILVDVDFTDGWLTLSLSQTVTRKWVEIFRNQYSHPTIDMVILPQFFDVRDKVARIAANERLSRVDEHSIQHIIDTFKTYLVSTNNLYRDYVIKKQRDEEDARRKELRRRIEAEELRQKILNNIEI